MDNPPGYWGALRSIRHIGNTHSVARNAMTQMMLIFPAIVNFFITNKIIMAMLCENNIANFVVY